jgi:uncharacterized protein (TIGR00106 family)
MPIMEISVVPVGTNTPSVSRYVASCVDILRHRKGIRYELTAMGTIVESEALAPLMRLAEEMHVSVFSRGVQRVVTTIKIDDRRDKAVSIAGKVKSVRRNMKRK